jgi:hypothetical protein
LFECHFSLLEFTYYSMRLNVLVYEELFVSDSKQYMPPLVHTVHEGEFAGLEF